MNYLKSIPKIFTLWIAILILGILTPIITSDVPILAKSEDGILIPMLDRETQLMKNPSYQWRVNPLLPYHAETLNGADHIYASPGKMGHILGADGMGRDTLAGILYGLRLALLVAIIALFIAGFIGLMLGMTIGYLGNERWRSDLFKILLAIGLTIISLFLLSRFKATQRNGIAVSILLFALYLVGLKIISLLPALGKTRAIPLDRISMTLLEWYESVPGLIILMALSTYMGGLTIYGVGILIGLLMIPYVVRISRAEVLKIRDRGYVMSARAMNLSLVRLLYTQILPVILVPLAVVLSFGIGSAILIEASLSFLGLGLSVNTITLGSMINEARSAPHAWWLILGPGLVVYLLISLSLALGTRLVRQ